MMGRPTLYTAEVAERILQQMSSGRTLRDVCKDHGSPAYGTVRQWEMDDREGFAARCRRAREIGNARPGATTLYTAEIADRILTELMGGRTLADVCRDPGTPASSTVRQWAAEDREGFAARYDRAREIGYHTMADEIIEIADDDRNDTMERRKGNGDIEIVLNPVNVSRSRLRCDERRWLLSKALPRIYGDRLDPNARREVRDTLAEFLREIDGSTRGLPNQPAMTALPVPEQDDNDDS